MGIETVAFGLAVIGGVCLGITLIGLTICAWALIFMVMREEWRDSKLVEEEKPATTRTRRSSTTEGTK